MNWNLCLINCKQVLNFFILFQSSGTIFKGRVTVIITIYLFKYLLFSCKLGVSITLCITPLIPCFQDLTFMVAENGPDYDPATSFD